MKREEIINQLTSLNEKQGILRDQLAEIDKQELVNKASKFISKYFKIVDKHGRYIRCLYVYGISKENNLKGLCVQYYKDLVDTYYSIDYNSTFNPHKYEDDAYEWNEINKDEFELHYSNTQKIINNIIKK